MKKIIAIAALSAAIISVNARTIWTGTCTFADYQVESGERPVFNPTDFADAVIGDKIIFNITDYSADNQSWHQVELWQYDGEKPGPNALGTGVHVLPGMVTAEFTIDETLLAGLMSGETCAAGTGYTVRSIELTTFDGTIWEGNCMCADWVPNPAVTLQGSNFAVAEEGDALIFTVEKLINGSYACIQIDQATTYSPGKFGTTEINDGQTEVKFVLNAELLADLVTNGINITGMNFKLTKIQLLKGSGEVPPVESGLWSGSKAISWSDYVTINADKFNSLKAGDQLVFTVVNALPEAQICLKQNLASGWEEMPSAEGDYGNYIKLEEGDNTAYFPLVAAAVESITQNGLVITGFDYTLMKVDIISAPVVENAIWSGSMTAGDWEHYATIEPERLADVKNGSVLAFTVENVADGAQLSLKQRLPEGWAEMPSENGEYGNYLKLEEGAGVYYFHVNEAAAASMKEYGMDVAGFGYTLTLVAYSDSDAVESIFIDSNLASGVYNLQGVKVSDSIEHVKTPGIYISGGKKYVVR